MAEQQSIERPSLYQRWQSSYREGDLPYEVELIVRALYYYPIYLQEELIPEFRAENESEDFIASIMDRIPKTYQLIGRITEAKNLLSEWYKTDELVAKILGQACVHYMTCDDEWIRDNTSAQSRLLAMLCRFRTRPSTT